MRTNNRWYPYFKDCVGALDGSLIPAHVPFAKQARYRDRHNGLSQNCLMAVGFDMLYHYVLAGWEGSATDALVLYSALHWDNNIEIPTKGDIGMTGGERSRIPGEEQIVEKEHLNYTPHQSQQQAMEDIDESDLPRSGINTPDCQATANQRNSRRKHKKEIAEAMNESLEKIAGAIQSLVERIYTPMPYQIAMREMTSMVNAFPGIPNA